MKKTVAIIMSMVMICLCGIRYNMPVVQAEDSEKIKVMPLGDSITDGFLTNVGGGYRDKLCDLLEENGYSDMIDFVGSMSKGNGYDTDHEGHSGWAIEPVPGADNLAEPGNTRYGLSTNIREWLETYEPQVVMLQIGTNDLLSIYKLDEIEIRLTNLVDTILEYIPEDGMLFLSTIPLIDTNKTSWSWLKKIETEVMNGYVEDYNFIIEYVAEDKINEDYPVTFVDMHSVLTSDDLEAGDGVHPNKAGYEKMGEYWYGILENYLNTPEPTPTQPTTAPTQPSTAPTQPSETNPTTAPTVAPTTVPTVAPTNPTIAPTYATEVTKAVPKVSKIKSLKNTKKGTVKGTIKKVSGVKGYKIYMSQKKKGTYKAIATLNKNSKVTFTKKGLKKGKTYYFKVRSFVKKNGKTVLSKFSAPKSIKVRK